MTERPDTGGSPDMSSLRDPSDPSDPTTDLTWKRRPTSGSRLDIGGAKTGAPIAAGSTHRHGRSPQMTGHMTGRVDKGGLWVAIMLLVAGLLIVCGALALWLLFEDRSFVGQRSLSFLYGSLAADVAQEPNPRWLLSDPPLS